MNSLILGIVLGLIPGAIAVLIINAIWHRHCDQISDNWYELAQRQTKEWAEFATELIARLKARGK
jgi:predicted outer membrane lipoprotein